MTQYQTLHDLDAVTIDAQRGLVLLEGSMSNGAPLILGMHRRILAGVIGSLIHANGEFPKSKGSDGLPIQPLKLSGASAIAMDNGQQAIGAYSKPTGRSLRIRKGSPATGLS